MAPSGFFVSWQRRLSGIGLCVAALMLGGCGTSLREHVRARDFRSVRAAEEPRPAASPLPNVPDMPGWTSDLGTALEFARENSRRTIVFVQQSGHPASERAKEILTSSEVENALGRDLKVAVDASEGADLSRLSVQETPALVVLDSAGAPVAQRTGSMSKKVILSALRE